MNPSRSVVAGRGGGGKRAQASGVRGGRPAAKVPVVVIEDDSQPADQPSPAADSPLRTSPPPPPTAAGAAVAQLLAAAAVAAPGVAEVALQQHAALPDEPRADGCEGLCEIAGVLPLPCFPPGLVPRMAEGMAAPLHREAEVAGAQCGSDRAGTVAEEARQAAGMGLLFPQSRDAIRWGASGRLVIAEPPPLEQLLSQLAVTAAEKGSPGGEGGGAAAAAGAVAADSSADLQLGGHVQPRPDNTAVHRWAFVADIGAWAREQPAPASAAAAAGAPAAEGGEAVVGESLPGGVGGVGLQAGGSVICSRSLQGMPALK